MIKKCRISQRLEWIKKSSGENLFVLWFYKKNCQAGDIEDGASMGMQKLITVSPIFNYAIAYDTKSKEPIFYETYPGSINDVSQITIMIIEQKDMATKE